MTYLLGFVQCVPIWLVYGCGLRCYSDPRSHFLSDDVQQQAAVIDKTKLTSRPKEGDLVYFPLGDRLFEIKYVEHERPFYQLQKNYVYELRCELFRLDDELIDTGIDEIDDVLVGGELTGETEDGISTLTGPSQ